VILAARVFLANREKKEIRVSLVSRENPAIPQSKALIIGRQRIKRPWYLKF
jgi:hypothetical protein